MTTGTKTKPIRTESEAKQEGVVVPAALQGAWWKWSTGLLMCFVIYGAFFVVGGAFGFTNNGEAARIVFFHVPSAVLSSLCYFIGMTYAALYLFSRRFNSLEVDAKSAISMELGFLFCILATVTGSIFAKIQWHNFWNWDPRETSIVIMLLLYASYLILRGAMAGRPDARARLSAVYALIALVPAQFLIWVVPRILDTNHPKDVISKPSGNSMSYNVLLYLSFLAFTMLFVWLFQLRLRAYKLTVSREETS